MKMSLILSSVSQDQRSSSEGEAFFGWMHGPSAGCDGARDRESTVHSHQLDATKLPKYSLRAEAWGGVLVYGPTQAVYQADHQAFSLLVRLWNGESLDDLRTAPAPASPEEVKQFAEMLIALKLT